jgi:hypothetical protein
MQGHPQPGRKLADHFAFCQHLLVTKGDQAGCLQPQQVLQIMHPYYEFASERIN